METVFLVLCITAIAVMFYSLYRVSVLRKKVPGGVVKSTWNFLSALVVMFTVGYLTTPFFPMLPQNVKDILVGVIFLAGAIFVAVVVNLFYRVVSDLGL